jgi:hypothetical protein
LLSTSTSSPTNASITLTSISENSGSSLNDFTISATGGANWVVGDLIAVGDPYFNGGVLRVLTASSSVTTVTVVKPGKDYAAGAAQIGAYATYVTLSAMRV